MRARGNLYETFLAGVEPDFLRRVLHDCDWNQSKAALLLGLNRATLRKKLQHYRITKQAEPQCTN